MSSSTSSGTSARIGERQLAEPLPRLRPDGDRPDEDAALAVGRELHEAGPLRALVRREPPADDVVARGDHAVALQLADRRDLRIGEHGRRDRAVVGGDVAARDVRRGDARLVLAEVRQEPDPGGVADRPHAVRRAQPVVDRHAAPRDLDVELFETELVDVRSAARRDEQALGVDRLSRSRASGGARPTPARRARLSFPRTNADPVLLEALRPAGCLHRHRAARAGARCARRA